MNTKVILMAALLTSLSSSAFAECYAGAIKTSLSSRKVFRLQGEGCFTDVEAQDWCDAQELPLGYHCYVVRQD